MTLTDHSVFLLRSAKLVYIKTQRNVKRQCPLRPSEIKNMWHMMKNQNSPFFVQRYLMVTLETRWHFLLRNYF